MYKEKGFGFFSRSLPKSAVSGIIFTMLASEPKTTGFVAKKIFCNTMKSLIQRLTLNQLELDVNDSSPSYALLLFPYFSYYYSKASSLSGQDEPNLAL